MYVIGMNINSVQKEADCLKKLCNPVSYKKSIA